MDAPTISTDHGPPQGPAPTLPSVGLSGLQALAFNAINTDTKLVLSDPSKILIGSLDVALNELKTAGLDVLKTQALSVLDSVAVDVIGTTISSVIETVPFVGTFVSAVIKLFELAFGGPDPAVVDRQYCQILQSMKPPQTGSALAGVTTVPADTFARIHQTPSVLYSSDGYGSYMWYDPLDNGRINLAKLLRTDNVGRPGMGSLRGFLPGVWYYRSAIGMAIMAATEGCPVDIDDVSFKAITGASKRFWALREYENMTPKQARSLWKVHLNTQIAGLGGMTRDTREQFMAIRRGIESCYGPSLKPGTSSDGGVALWTGFLDLFMREVQQGRCNRYRVIDWLSRWPMFGNRTVQDGCLASMADQVMAISLGWERAVHPYYSQGQAKMAAIADQAAEVAAKSARAAADAGKDRLAKKRRVGQVPGQWHEPSATMGHEGQMDLLETAIGGLDPVGLIPDSATSHDGVSALGGAPDVGEGPDGMASPDLTVDQPSREGPPEGGGGFMSTMSDLVKNAPVKDMAAAASSAFKSAAKPKGHGKHKKPSPEAEFWRQKYEAERIRCRTRLKIKPKTDVDKGPKAPSSEAPKSVTKEPPKQAEQGTVNASNSMATSGGGVLYIAAGVAAVAAVAVVATVAASKKDGAP